MDKVSTCLCSQNHELRNKDKSGRLKLTVNKIQKISVDCQVLVGNVFPTYFIYDLNKFQILILVVT